jgi:hypothetical protein
MGDHIHLDMIFNIVTTRLGKCKNQSSYKPRRNQSTLVIKQK